MRNVMINFRRVIFFKKNSPKRNILWFLVNSIYYDMKFFYLIFFNNQNQNNQKMNKYVNVMIQIKRSIDRTLFFPKCQQSVDNYNQIIWKIHKKKFCLLCGDSMENFLCAGNSIENRADNCLFDPALSKTIPMPF